MGILLEETEKMTLAVISRMDRGRTCGKQRRLALAVGGDGDGFEMMGRALERERSDLRFIFEVEPIELADQ